MKYVMALAVIAIHYRPLFEEVEYPPYVEWFIRLAVPFFFMISGFLMGRKLESKGDFNYKKSYLLDRSKHFFRIFIIWLAIYLPLAVYYYIANNKGFAESVFLYSSKVVFKGHGPYSWPLWFIYSLAIVCFCVAYSLKKRWLQVVLIFLFILSYLSDYLAFNFSEIKIAGINRMVFGHTLGGGIYIVLGFYLQRFLHILKHKNIPGILLILLSAFLFYSNLPFWKPVGGLGFGLLSIGLTLRKSPVWVELRVQSIWIYFTHMYVIFLFELILKHFNIENPTIYLSTAYIICITLGYGLSQLQKNPRYHKFSKLIT